MFVGGLSWDTSNGIILSHLYFLNSLFFCLEESLKEYFEKFGSVHEAVVMRNQPLNKPR